MNRLLVLFAHPAIHKSRVNRAMAAAARKVEGVTFHDLYEAYPDFLIDVEAEQQRLLSHDVIVLQHPFYWYSTPAIMKEWIDLVLEYGFAYGEGGDRLRGKSWVHALTTGGPEDSYRQGGYNRYSIPQFLAPLEQTAELCGMRFLPPFVAYGTLRADPRREVPEICDRYEAMLRALVVGEGAP